MDANWLKKTIVFNFIFCLFSIYAFSEVIDYIMATVNGEVITYSQFKQRVFEIEEAYKTAYSGEELEKQLRDRKKSILDDLIKECLLLGEAKRENIKVDKIEIEKMVNTAKSKFKSLDDFYDALRNEGLTLETLEEKYKKNLMIKKIIQFKVNSKVRIEPYEISQYYQAHQKDFLEPEQVKIRQILIKIEDNEKVAEQTANELLERIKGGEDMAREGEDLGFINVSELLPELGVATSKLKVNEIADLVKTQTGYHIIRLEGRKLSKVRKLSEVRDEIYRILFSRKADRIYVDLVDKLKKKADIDIKKNMGE
ncbi:MAG: SurA N-terminal domain-containing protein [bacterium]|nr:SurA N-terminal domain-containing protein [bacterium]